MAGLTGDLSVEAASNHCLDIVERVEEAVVVERRVLFETLAGVIARGHVLVEDVPGTGKTVLARVLAESLGLEFNRVQFTPDLLPADVTGSNVYNEHEREFEFAQGPVFSNVVLADEINRAPPKTQSALLESMEERQVSVDGTTHPLPTPFVVIATQNPVEQEGTFQLPEAQRDRFSVKTSMNYPDVEGEMGLLDRRANRRTIAPSVDPVVDPETVRALQECAEDIRVDTKVRRYIVDLARATREDDRTEIGVSPRGVQRVFEAVRASAVIAGRRYSTPDDVKRLANATMSHRLVLTTEATIEGTEKADVIQAALDAVDVPAVSPNAPDTDDTPKQTTTGGSERADSPSEATPDGDSRGQRPERSAGEAAENEATQLDGDDGQPTDSSGDSRDRSDDDSGHGQ
ncbi:MoxR family ATPase [Haloarcula hispanica]|uniref:MoxR family ATPase n=1 Tax=Haloarcula hispanica TaxID=51589 RepID=A0A482T569_HALHI|nr:MoxR family ATPase [Haloarcula hispanica]MCJ0618897.1 MoxR family ATPase [Haloarcula hispanica]RYJ09442.1 MoxR family ATPase [Haloarcula hispanica]